MSDYTWTGNPWYDLNGNYFANAEDAERQRSRQRERQERDEARMAAEVEGTDGMGMPVWCLDCSVPLTDEEADRGATCALCASRSQHAAAQQEIPTMSMYFPGYDKAREMLERKDRDGLLRVLDDLFGRDHLPEDYTLADLRDEARRQLREEFTDKMSPEYERSQFWIKACKAWNPVA